jgi:hypothetical protein
MFQPNGTEVMLAEAAHGIKSQCFGSFPLLATCSKVTGAAGTQYYNGDPKRVSKSV